MGEYYVRSWATGGAKNGANWANAYVTLAAAAAGKAAGDKFYVAMDHSETTSFAAVILNFPNGPAVTLVVCVDHTGSVPPVAADVRTGAVINGSGTDSGIFVQGTVAFYGVSFSAGNGGGTFSNMMINLGAGTQNSDQHYTACNFQMAHGFPGMQMRLGADSLSSTIIWDNCTTTWFYTGHTLAVYCTFEWKNTAAAIPAGSAIPDTLLGSGRAFVIEIHAVNLSALAGAAIIGGGTDASNSRCRISDCRVEAATTWPTSFQGNVQFDLYRVGATALYYTFMQAGRYYGATTSDLINPMVGGATDNYHPFSWYTNGGGSGVPYDSPWITVWNDTVGALLELSVEVLFSFGLTNRDIWIEAEYLADASSPLGGFATSYPAKILDAAVTIPDSAAAWETVPNTLWHPHPLKVTFTPMQKGLVNARVRIGGARAAYINPVFTLGPAP